MCLEERRGAPQYIGLYDCGASEKNSHCSSEGFCFREAGADEQSLGAMFQGASQGVLVRKFNLASGRKSSSETSDFLGVRF